MMPPTLFGRALEKANIASARTIFEGVPAWAILGDALGGQRSALLMRACLRAALIAALEEIKNAGPSEKMVEFARQRKAGQRPVSSAFDRAPFADEWEAGLDALLAEAGGR